MPMCCIYNLNLPIASCISVAMLASDWEAPSMLTGSGSFNRSIEGQQISTFALALLIFWSWSSIFRETSPTVSATCTEASADCWASSPRHGLLNNSTSRGKVLPNSAFNTHKYIRKKHPCGCFSLTGNALSSQSVSRQVLSAYECLTTVFGMGTGGTTQLSSPDIQLSIYATLKTIQKLIKMYFRTL